MASSDPIDDLLDEGLAILFGGGEPHGDSAPSTPTRLGDYRILREIGRGGMGVVYLAEQESLRRTVALKVLPAHLTLSAEAVARFQVEASSAARLHHPGIVPVHAVDECDGHHFFAMEFVDGSPLHEVIQELRGVVPADRKAADFVRALGATRCRDTEGLEERTCTAADSGTYVETVCLLVAGVADALQHAHESGVLHRDVKPSNILVRPDGTPVLSDFGLARDLGEAGLTRTGVFAGTPHYTSPEQVRGCAEAVDRRTDVFSLGVTLYELLTSQLPFGGATTQEVLRSVEEREPPNPRRFDPHLARDVVTIVLKALEKEPGRRYGTAAELADDLRAFVAKRPIRARRASRVARVSKFVARHRGGSLAAACAFLLAATAAWYWASIPGFLTVVSVPPGATVFVDGISVGATTPLVRLPRPAGVYVVHTELILDGRALVGLPTPVEVVRREDSPPETFPLVDADAVLEDALSGTDIAQQWIRTVRRSRGDPRARAERPFHQAVNERLDELEREFRSELESLLRTGDVDSTKSLVEKLSVLTGTDEAADRVHACREKNSYCEQRERQVKEWIDSDHITEADAAIAELEEMDEGRFEPAVKAATRLRKLLADARRDHRKADTEGLMSTWSKEAHAASSAAEIRGILLEMEDRDPDHPRVAEVRNLLLIRESEERSDQDVLRLVAAAHAAFEQREEHVVGLVAEELEILHAEAHPSCVDRLGNALEEVRELKTILGMVLRAWELRGSEPADGLEALDALDPDTLPTQFREVAVNLIAELRVDLQSACARERALARLDGASARAVELKLADARKLLDVREAVPHDLWLALQLVRKLIADGKEFLAKSDLCEQRFQQVLDNIAKGKSAAASETLRELSEVWVQDLERLEKAREPDLLRRGARLALRLGRPDDAESLLASIEDVDLSIDDRIWLGCCDFVRWRSGGKRADLAAAIEHFDGALKGDPKSRRARSWRGLARYWQVGESSDADALRDLQAAAQKGSAGHLRLLARLHFEAACLRAQADPEYRAGFELARATGRQALEARFSEDDFLGLARFVDDDSGRFDTELESFRATLLFEVGVSDQLSEEWEESLSTLRRALELDGCASKVRVWLAYALAHLHRESEAVRHNDLAKRTRDQRGERWDPATQVNSKFIDDEVKGR